MISTQVITLFKIKQNVSKTKKDGGSFVATTIQGETDGGDAVDTLILQGILDKCYAMKEAVNNLKMGDTATIVFETKEGSKFKNVVGIYEGAVEDAKSQLGYSKPSGGSPYKKAESTFTPKSNYDTTGIQVGHAINNAVLLISNKVRKESLKEVAEEILRLSEELNAKHKAGVYSVVAADTKKESSSRASTFVEDNDIPFE